MGAATCGSNGAWLFRYVSFFVGLFTRLARSRHKCEPSREREPSGSSIRDVKYYVRAG
jgi:hypothetical protein